MSRLRRLICLIGVLGAVPGVLAATAGAAHKVYPARLLVYAQEWSLQPSRATLPAGRVTVQLWNRGQDPHDLRAQRMSGGKMTGRIRAVKLTLPGKVSTAHWILSPGRYMLFCSLPGHMGAGMHVQIRVLAG